MLHMAWCWEGTKCRELGVEFLEESSRLGQVGRIFGGALEVLLKIFQGLGVVRLH